MKIKVFVVDDQVDMRLLIYRILTRKGYEVQTDATGEITRLKVIEKADLILLDVNLENTDGRELCKELKEREATKSIPIILISAVPDLSETYHLCGAEGYLRKPFSSEDLIKKVEGLVQAA